MNLFMRRRMSPQFAVAMPPMGRARWPAAKVPNTHHGANHGAMVGGMKLMTQLNGEEHEYHEIAGLQRAAEGGQGEGLNVASTVGLAGVELIIVGRSRRFCQPVALPESMP